jgi:hypothetical protein
MNGVKTTERQELHKKNRLTTNGEVFCQVSSSRPGGQTTKTQGAGWLYKIREQHSPFSDKFTQDPGVGRSVFA